MAQQAASLSEADMSLPQHGSDPYLLIPQLLQKSLGSPPCSVPARQTDGLRAPLGSETSPAPKSKGDGQGLCIRVAWVQTPALQLQVPWAS